MRFAAISFFLIAASLARAGFYDGHVIFYNALVPGCYPHTEARVVAPSTVTLERGCLSVTRERCHSPPNALRFQWKSATGGDWTVMLHTPGADWRVYGMVGDTLSFWIFSENEISELGAPRISLFDKEERWSKSLPLVQDGGRIPAGRWVEVRLPLAKIEGLYRDTSDKVFTPARTVGVVFTQGLDDNVEHTVYLDDVMLIDGSAPPDREAPSTPDGLGVTGYERHFDLTWKRSPESDVLSYRIHRSLDGKNYEVIGSQRGDWMRYEDFVAPGESAQYRISAVDRAGNESPLSAPVRGQTRPMNDGQLLDMVQLGCFRYYWDAGHPGAGLAPEILPGDENLLAVGGNGFGVMALLVAAERQFITREQAAGRLTKILGFLARAPRYHGAWAHFLDGRTAQTVPFFGKYDDGGDLVETAFMIQGLLAARQYFDRDTAEEKAIRDTITRFWHEVEWDWYRQRPDSDVLYWHWSPNHGFFINHPLIGWNETAIVYLLAIASPTHPVPASLWHTGWAGKSPLHVEYRRTWSRTTQGDHFTNGNTYYGIPLEVGEGNGAELFFTHFSFLGFDPRGRRDAYTNYFKNNRAIALIQRAYAMENPRQFAGYGANTWGRSAGVNSGGGRALPRDDNGTISIMASLASMPYTPDESMEALRHFYRDLGPKIWGPYGFYDGFNETQNRFDPDYMALNQAPIVVMIENHRTGLVWKKFMANPEIGPALDAIGFVPDEER